MEGGGNTFSGFLLGGIQCRLLVGAERARGNQAEFLEKVLHIIIRSSQEYNIHYLLP